MYQMKNLKIEFKNVLKITNPNVKYKTKSRMFCYLEHCGKVEEIGLMFESSTWSIYSQDIAQ